MHAQKHFYRKIYCSDNEKERGIYRFYGLWIMNNVCLSEMHEMQMLKHHQDATVGPITTSALYIMADPVALTLTFL